MTEEAIRGRVQLLTQAAALLVVVAYIAGFLTLSLHHASYGISQFSLLRPRILSAGTIFLILMTLGAVSAVQIFDLWKLNYPTRTMSADAMGPTARGEGPQPPKFFRSSIFMLRILTLLQFATFLSVMISIYVFTGDYDLVDRSGVWGLLLVFIGPAGIATASLQVKKRPMLSLIVTALTLLMVGFCIWRIHEKTLGELLLWFAFCAFIAHSLSEVITNPIKLREANWHWALFWSISLLTLFATKIYPCVKPSLGGGAPIPVTFQFTDNFSLPNSATKLWLIDENEGGFYVISAPDAKSAVFIPRGFIKTISFQGGQNSDSAHRPQTTK